VVPFVGWGLLNTKVFVRVADVNGGTKRIVMPDLIYLASPYSDFDSRVRLARFHAVVIETAKMAREGHLVFSPICHSHPVATIGCLPLAFDYWQEWNREMLRRCEKLVVLKLDGWEESQGVQGEIEMAKALGMPIEYREVSDGN